MPSRLRTRTALHALFLTASIGAACGDDDAASGDDGSGAALLAPYGVAGTRQTLQEAASGADCTVFRPADLAAEPAPLPVVIWGNGTFANPGVYAAALSHLASRGFVVAAANTANAGHGTEMAACLDWLTAEQTRAGSPLMGRLDLAHVGASGHSQGGGGTLMFGRDPRVTASAPFEPYIQPLFGHDPESQSHQHGPMLLLSGGNDQVAPAAQNQQPVFTASNVPTVWATLLGADHVASASGDMSGFRAPITAWFSYHLQGDQAAKGIFYGSACALCTDSAWTVQQKAL